MARTPGLFGFPKKLRRTDDEIRDLRLRRGDDAFLFDGTAITTNPAADTIDIASQGGGITMETGDGDLDIDLGGGGSVNVTNGSAVNCEDDLSVGGQLFVNYRAINQAVLSGATSLAVSFSGLSLSNQFNSSFGVLVTPHWDTTVWVTSKATTGFTVNFGTAPGADSHLDWLIVR